MPEIEIHSLFFDSVWYLETYTDVASANANPIEHYLLFGYREGRNPNRFFNTSFYLKTYPDIAASSINPFIHYIIYGANEGRLPRPNNHPPASDVNYISKSSTPDPGPAAIEVIKPDSETDPESNIDFTVSEAQPLLQHDHTSTLSDSESKTETPSKPLTTKPVATKKKSAKKQNADSALSVKKPAILFKAKPQRTTRSLNKKNKTV